MKCERLIKVIAIQMLQRQMDKKVGNLHNVCSLPQPGGEHRTG